MCAHTHTHTHTHTPAPPSNPEVSSAPREELKDSEWEAEPCKVPAQGGRRVGERSGALGAQPKAQLKHSSKPILKEISPECSLEGLMLKLKLQYFGHLMRKADSLENTLMLGKG